MIFMRRLTFSHQRNLGIVLMLMSVCLLFWRTDRQIQIWHQMGKTAFLQHHYYSLNTDSGHVADFYTYHEALQCATSDSARIDSIYRMLKEQQSEMNYYLRVHGVQDEGYNMIADYALTVDHRTDSIERLLNHIISIKRGTPYSIVHQVEYYGKHKRQTNHNIKGDSLGIYTGEMNGLRQPDGHGSYQAYDGSYYEGAWKDGRRQGFGFSIAPWKPLRAGEWEDDRYKGERVNYTSERIYGIDISRYQHEKGRKKFGINWKELRITHLGSLSKKKITGKTDYPVSFVYIKSTEGSSVRNKYFAADYTNARKLGIHVGAYHFFSTRSTGISQAKFFVKHTHFRKGDFPPVLDVEPSRKQIEEIGGAHQLFLQIRTWMRHVETHTGVRPILYVSQSFVNRYLEEVPDIKKKYKVWIARYGEYKPDVQLAIWQLSPDGRVRGIKVPVDINVFNGYGDQYEEFLQKELIP